MKRHLILVAGGTGTRMGVPFPKQFMEISGTPLLLLTLKRFYQFDGQLNIIIVLPEAHINAWQNICDKFNVAIPHEIARGGETRFHSVKNGLGLINENGIVAIHDGVRPFVTNKVINTCFKMAEEKECVVPVVPLNDSIRKVEGDKNYSVDRNYYRIVQTPQCFSVRIIKKAYEQKYSASFTDDASVAEAAGNKIFFVDGNIENIKITNPSDIAVAEVLLKRSMK